MSAPHKLADGSWSDGVDRTHRINTMLFMLNNNTRWHVWRTADDNWEVTPSIEGEVAAVCFTTHAEAIAYADRKARE